MCGITGFWLSKRVDETPSDVLANMGSTLAHRGPDDSGVFYDNSCGIGLSFRRLSIIDLSPEGHQPMSSKSGRYTIIFNGEVYNFEEIRTELGDLAWRGHSDTEVMLAAIERWGLEAAVSRFVGMFAFALWDSLERKLHLVRDRLGIKPLYYGFSGRNFVFASELKAICAFPDFEAGVDRDALCLYMRFGYVPAPHSIYENIYKLKQGHILTLSAADTQPVIRPYWSAVEGARAGANAPLKITDEEAIDQLEEKLLTAVRLRMIADVPLGAFLSGGIDSSTVVALMQSLSSRPVKTFSIGFHESSYNEALHAREVARHLGTDHTELYVTPQDALDVVPMLASMYDEPFADSSQIPTHLVSRLAREHVTVSLSGDGGDELFGGYLRYAFIKSMWSNLEKVPRPLAVAGAKMLQVMPQRALNRVADHLPLRPRLKKVPDKLKSLAQLLSSGNPEDIYLLAVSHWPEPEKVVPGARQPDTVAGALAALHWLPTATEQAMLADLLFYLADDILTKVDRASMAVSLEARVPLLDHRVVEFAWRLPLSLKIRNGKTKWILRQLLYRHVPPELVERPKMGFGVPIDSWLRGPLRQWAEDLLSADNLRRGGFLAVDPIRKKWDEHLRGAKNWDYPLWNALVFQDWLAKQRSHSATQLTSTRAY